MALGAVVAVTSTEERRSAVVAAGRFGVLAMALLPLVTTSGAVFAEVVAKGVYLRLVTLGILGALAVLLLTRPTRMAGRDAGALTFLLYVAVAAIAASLGPAPVHSYFGDVQRMGGVLTWAGLAAYYVGLRTFLDERDWVLLLRLCTVVALAANAWALARGDAASGGGTFGNPSYLAIHAALTLALAVLVGVAPAAGMVWRGISIAAAGSAIGVLAIGSERGAVLAAVAGIATGCLAYPVLSRRWRPRQLARPFAMAAGIVVLGVAAVLGVAGSDAVLPRAVATARSNPGLRYRLDMWKAALDGFVERPVLGIGPENFSLVFSRHFDPAVYGIGDPTYVDRVHNGYLEVLIATGMVGLLLYLAFWVAHLRRVARCARVGRCLPIEGAALAGAFVAYLTYLLFWFEDLSSISVMVMLAALTATRATGAPLVEIGAPRPTPTLRGVVATAALLALAFVGYQHGVRVMLAARAGFRASAGAVEDRLSEYRRVIGYGAPEAAELVIRMVEDLQRSTDDLPRTRGDPYRAAVLAAGVEDGLGWLDSTLRMDPRNDRWWLQRGSLLTFAATLHADGRYLALAMADVRRAIELSPDRLRLYHFLAQQHLLAGDPAGGRAVVRAAIARYDELGESHRVMAMMLVGEGKYGEAGAALERAIRLGEEPDARVVGEVAARLAGDEPVAAERLLACYLELVFRTRLRRGPERVAAPCGERSPPPDGVTSAEVGEPGLAERDGRR